MEKESIRDMVSLVLKAVALAMGVAVVVLSRLGELEPRTAATLLGVGLACAGAAMMGKKE